MPKEKCEIYINGVDVDDGTGTGTLTSVYVVAYNKKITASSPKQDKFNWHFTNQSGHKIEVSVNTFMINNTVVADTKIFQNALAPLTLKDGQAGSINAQVKTGQARQAFSYTISILNLDAGTALKPLVDTPVAISHGVVKLFTEDIDPELDILDV